jgi:hypothetical protein
LPYEQLFDIVMPVSEQRSAGLYVEVAGPEGQPFQHFLAPHSVTVRVGTSGDQYVRVQVTDDGQWVVSEVTLSGSPHIIARGRLPSSHYEDDRRADQH